MGMIRINIDAVLGQSTGIENARQTVGQVRSSVDSLYHQIDSRILERNNIASRMRSVSRQLDGIQNKIGRIQTTVESGANSYYAADMQAVRDAKEIAGSAVTVTSVSYAGTKLNNYQTANNEFGNWRIPEHTGYRGKRDFDWNFIKDIIITKPFVLPGVLSLVSPVTGLVYLTSGIYYGDTPSFFDYSRTPSANASADWLGYEWSEDNPGVTAWVGKASAEAQNEWGYAGVNAHLGKVEAEAKADFSFMETKNESEYKDGKWAEKSRTDFIKAEAEAGASVSVLDAEAEAGVGSDMLGIEGKAEGSVGTAKAEAKGKFSISEDGINANVKGEAMVAAAEGEASGTINILGIEITGKVGGYAGALGAEGKFGIEDNKFVAEGGAAALLGVSAGVEIGFNDEGWDNFVDFVVFWD